MAPDEEQPANLSHHIQRSRQRTDDPSAQRNRELEAAYRISQVLFQAVDVDEVIETALQTALEETDAEAGSVLLADPESRQLIFRHSIGEKPVPRGTAMPWDQGIAGTVFHTGQPAIVGDVQADHRHFTHIDDTVGYSTRNMITLPLKRWKGEPIGVLNVLNKRKGLLDEQDLALLTILSAFAAIAIQQAKLLEEAKMAEVVQLLGNIGHDLKNLLQPVVTGTCLLKTELDEVLESLRGFDENKARASEQLSSEIIEMVQNTITRIHDRVKEIADCVKGVKDPPQFAPCTLSGVIGNVLQTLKMPAAEKRITLRVENLDTLPVIQADERRLYNAFYNLVNNAIPAVPPGGSIVLRGDVNLNNGTVVVSVSDSGRGMPPEVVERLFTSRVVSTKASGTGLGTKIIKDVVDAHKGLITVESTEGVGTTFHLRFPINRERSHQG